MTPASVDSAPLREGQSRHARAALVIWGESLGRALTAGDVLLLSGDVGAGKTTLAQAIARGYGVAEPVTSPTFTVVHEYETPRGVLRHADLYRLRGPQELDVLGWDELVAGDAPMLVEWPERAEGRWPSGAWHITLLIPPDHPDERDVVVERVS